MKPVIPAVLLGLSLLGSPSICFAQSDAQAVSSDLSLPSDAQAGDAQAAPKEKPKEPQSVDEAVQSGLGTVSAFKGGKYREAVASLIMLLMFLWRRLGAKFLADKLSGWQMTLVAGILGYVGSIPEALTLEPFSWWTFAWQGLITGSEAVMLWQILGKKLLPKMFGEPAPTKDKAAPEAPKEAAPKEA